MLFPCENPDALISQYSDGDTLSGIVADSVVFHRSDSGIVKMELRTPKLVQTNGDDGNMMEFPQGFTAFVYGNDHAIATKFQADYGKSYGKSSLLEAIGNVVVENPGSQTMYSEKLYWYQAEKMLHTRSRVRILTSDKQIEADSLVANEDFSEYTLYSGSAEIDIDEEE